MAKTLLNAAIEIETMVWLQQVQEASLMSWDGFIDCVLKVGLEGFDDFTGVTERQELREEGVLKERLFPFLDHCRPDQELTPEELNLLFSEEEQEDASQ